MSDEPSAARGPAPTELVDRIGRLSRGAQVLADLDGAALADTWQEFLSLLAPDGAAEDTLAIVPPRSGSPGLARLSKAGFREAVRAMVAPLRTVPRSAFQQASIHPARSCALVVLASNIPLLVLQPLLAGLIRRRPLLIKAASDDGGHTREVVERLGQLRPELHQAIGAIAWSGGGELDEVATRGCAPVLVYGGAATVERYRELTAARALEFGPKTSLALLTRVPSSTELEGLVRDVALFDQRGCLSVQLVLTSVAPELWIERYLAALADYSRRCPPGSRSAAEIAHRQQGLLLAEMRGALVHLLPDRAGGVIVAEGAEQQLLQLPPGPGHRIVAVHRVDSAPQGIDRLAALRGLLQGASLLGSAAWRQQSALRELGISHIAELGQLQSPPWNWANGNVDLLGHL